MQSEKHIPETHVVDVIAAVFAQGSPLVYELSSVPEEELRSFSSALALEAEIALRVPEERSFFAYSIYYPAAKGVVNQRKFDLIPEKNGGKRFQFRAEGWGLIQLQLSYRDEGVDCRVAVNSEKRALAWSSTYHDLGHPSHWDWKVVEKHARRIIRAMKRPNKAPEPTPTAVTSRASARLAPCAVVAHL